jgi:hypothetical protein
MTTRAKAILDEFKSLARAEQWNVYEAIARNIVPEDYGPLSDEDLTVVAAQTFAMLDEEEARAEPR